MTDPAAVPLVVPDEHPRAPILSAAMRAAGIEPGPEAPVVVLGELDAARRLASDGRRVLVVLPKVDRRVVTVVLDLGASGVASEADDDDALTQAARAVGAGYVVVPAAALQALRRPVFTARQKQILALLVMGLSNAEIAERLFITEPTVKTHLTQVFAQLGVRSRKEAIDAVLDPTSGLGPGILGIPEAERVQTSYGTPRFA